MTTVLLGSNTFIDVATILAIGSTRVLVVEVEPLRLTLRTPPKLPSGRTVNVVENEVRPGTAKEARVVCEERSVAIFWSQTPLATATLLEPTVASVRIDLRALGINVYDDVFNLHAGNGRLANNTFANSGVGIRLG